MEKELITNKENKMRKYVANFKLTNVAFNAQDTESVWIVAKNKKEAEQKAKNYAAWHKGMKFVGMYCVKQLSY
jgi:hypothetical protein